MEAAKRGLAGLAAYLADAHRLPGTLVATSTQVLDYIKGRLAAPEGRAALEAQPPHGSSRTIIEQAYDPASIERYLKIEAMIDNRIAKAMARLVAYKEYKKLYKTKPTRALPAEHGAAADAHGCRQGAGRAGRFGDATRVDNH